MRKDYEEMSLEELIQNYGLAEHNQDDGLALYILSLIKSKVEILDGIKNEYINWIKFHATGGTYDSFLSKEVNPDVC